MKQREKEMVKDLRAFVKEAKGFKTRRIRTVKLERIVSIGEFKDARKELFHATEEEMA